MHACMHRVYVGIGGGVLYVSTACINTVFLLCGGYTYPACVCVYRVCVAYMGSLHGFLHVFLQCVTYIYMYVLCVLIHLQCTHRQNIYIVYVDMCTHFCICFRWKV